MSTKDSQSYDVQQRQWAALQTQQYTYPQPPEDRSYLDPPTLTLTSHGQPSSVTSSFDYGHTYNQVSQSSTLLPSHGQYPHSETSQVQYASYPDPGYSDHQQPQHDYFPGSQHTFDTAVPALPDSSCPAQSVSSAYTSPPFPHQFSELGQACGFSAHSVHASLPTVTTPDTLAPAFSGFDVSFHSQAGSNKRQRSEEQEEDGGDPNSHARGDNTQLSAAEKLKRACARCRGLKVCHLSNILDKQGFKRSWIGPLPL
jgi:hypothetical protein